MSETKFCCVSLGLHLRTSESICSSNNKNSKVWWCQETLLDHLGREELRKVFASYLDVISILPISGSSKRNFQICLVGCRGKGQHKSRTEAENGTWRKYLITRPWDSSSSQPTALPTHPGRKSGLETLNREHLFVWIPVRFQVTIHGGTLGLLVELSFSSFLSHTFDPFLLAGSAWFPQSRLKVPGMHFSSLFLHEDWRSNPDRWTQRASQLEAKRAKSFYLIKKDVRRDTPLRGIFI